MRSLFDGGGSSGAGVNLAYMPALDGVRAVSILGIMLLPRRVLVGRAWLTWVDVFFVLSGFLITTLLLKEWARERHHSPFRLSGPAGPVASSPPFRAAGRDRVLRLAVRPALHPVGNSGGTASAPCSTSATGTRSSRDRATSPRYGSLPVLHTWTLAIEEQFYLVWPLVVLGVLKWRSRRPLLVVGVVGTLVSAVWMAHLYQRLRPSRLYYGTNTRAQDLLVGAAVALLLRRRARLGGPQDSRPLVPWSPSGASGRLHVGVADRLGRLQLAVPGRTPQLMVAVGVVILGCDPRPRRPDGPGTLPAATDLRGPDLLWPLPVALACLSRPRQRTDRTRGLGAVRPALGP